MDDTQHSAPPSGPPGAASHDEFEPHRLRSIADMRRSSDDRIVAGVCAGAARYLNIDPIVVRVVLAVLTVAGFAGVILYVAAWILLPAEDADKSPAAQWFNLDKNEEQVRVAGLVGAVILATLSIVGDSSWAWWGDAPWTLVPLAIVFYVFWARPRRRRAARDRREAALVPDRAASDDVAATTAQRAAAKPREPRSPALFGLTVSLAAIALAVTWIYEETQKDIHWTTYLAVALAIVGLGLLIGTFIGNGGPLIAIGILLAIALGIGSAFPSGRIGEQTPTPTTAADVRSHYKHGVGLLELDLTGVSDPDGLLGRTVTLDAGVGETTIIVPNGLNVDVDVDVDAGEIALFDEHDDGTSLSMSDTADEPTRPSLRIEIDQQLGKVEVIRS
jgi:phage shock protein PspC (stress-responsive transcriptional regulator)